jgi:uncharacterized protein
MDKRDIIIKAENFVKEKLKTYDSGHDWWHIVRVRNIAAYINTKEDLADPFLVEITALLHDIADSKFAGGNKDHGYELINDFMLQNGMKEISITILDVIKKLSFSSNPDLNSNAVPLLKVVQDADRLDAIGAIGVARAFNYGGFRNNRIYDPATQDPLSGGPSTVKHFYEKLLLLKDRLNTETGRQLAIQRHEYLKTFLEQFYKEWNFATNETTDHL